MKRFLPSLLVLTALTIAIGVAGCGGKTSTKTLTRDDLVGVVGPPPDTPAGASYLSGPAVELGLADLAARAQTASDRATLALFKKAGLLQVYQRSFDGATNVADATAYLFKDAAGAGSAFAGLQKTLARQAGPDRKLVEVPAKDLGDEAWGAHITGGSEAALFLFRKSNLVVVTDMSCDAKCDADIVSATRAYADAIATRASEAAG